MNKSLQNLLETLASIGFASVKADSPSGRAARDLEAIGLVTLGSMAHHGAPDYIEVKLSPHRAALHNAASFSGLKLVNA